MIVTIAFAACLIPAQSDTWWQLRSGEEMWRSGRVMLHDEFTHTVAGQEWSNHEWLSHVVFYGTYALGGMPLLTLLCAAAITTAWAVVLLLSPGPPLMRVALVGFAALASSPGWSLRPQVLTLALCAVTLWILVRHRRLWMLPPLFLLWANLHGAVALGGVLVFSAWLAALVVDRDRLPALTLIGALCLAATAATPMGVSLWLEIPASLQRLQTYQVLEWRAPELTRLADLPLWIGAAAVLGLAVWKRERLNSPRVLTLIIASGLMFVLATRSQRNLPPFLVCAVPAIAILLSIREARRAASHTRAPQLHALALAAYALAAAVFVGAAWRTPLDRLGWRPVPDSVLSAISSCPGRLYNRYDEGGFLIWFLRDRKVFMDSRQDPFPPSLVLEHIEVERTGEYQAMFTRYDISCSLTVEGSALGTRLRRDGWLELEAGEGWKVYRRPGGSGSS